MKKALKWVTTIILIFVGVASVDFQIWHQKHLKRLESNSNLARTTQGIVEYAAEGDGPAVLVLHGTLGGYDQTQVLSKILAPSNHRFIFISRPGYLRTPLAAGPTFDEQADLYASLLDELGIDKAGLIAMSGGGPSALQFALRHPDRCWGMVLIAANWDIKAGEANLGGSDGIGGPATLFSKIILSDPISWMVVRASGVIPGEYLTAMVGKDYAKDILKDPEGSKYYCEFIDSLSLLSLRRDGSLNDGQQYLDYTGHPFEDIKAPSLILHGSKDSFVQPSESTTLHETLPNSDYIEIKGGTHFMIISHHDVLAPIINDFLNTHAPSK